MAVEGGRGSPGLGYGRVAVEDVDVELGAPRHRGSMSSCGLFGIGVLLLCFALSARLTIEGQLAPDLNHVSAVAAAWVALATHAVNRDPVTTMQRPSAASSRVGSRAGSRVGSRVSSRVGSAPLPPSRVGSTPPLTVRSRPSSLFWPPSTPPSPPQSPSLPTPLTSPLPPPLPPPLPWPLAPLLRRVPSSPPPLQGHARTVAHLNARFAAGRATNNLSQAGVIFRAFDEIDDHKKPWEPCLGCKSPDRFPTSIVYPQNTVIFNEARGSGFIVNPRGSSVFCSCYTDCHSLWKSCPTLYGDETCKPGCPRPCDPARGWKNWGCSWRGEEQLKYMIEQHTRVNPGNYNELLLDVRPWVQHLPGTVDAIFVLPTSSPDDTEYAKSTRDDFLRTYELDPETHVPIVLYDPQGHLPRPKRTLSPFSLYRPAELEQPL